MASIRDTINELAKMRGRINDSRDTIAQKGAEAMLEAKQDELDKGTYSRSIPSRSEYRAKPGSRRRGDGTAPAWKRTGALRDDQGIVSTGDGKREVRNTGTSAFYEPRLADLPTGPDGVNRSNDATPNAQRRGEERLPDIVADELTKVMRR